MKIRIYTFFEQLSGSFWFLPSVMVVAAILIAFVTTSIDQVNTQNAIPALSWLSTGSADGARSVLSTIAGSMISVAGVTFSITMVTLSLASSQLGPRVLNNFMRDTGNQVVLGTFIAIFTYCLIVLRSIRSSEDISFVPHLSLTVAMVLAIISLGVLIYFFHHVSMIIQAQNLIASIGRELEAGIERFYSIQSESSTYEHELRNKNDIPSDFDDNSNFVVATSSGYLQTIDYDSLLQVTTEHDLLLRLLCRPGDFVAKGSNIMATYSAKELSEKVVKDIHGTFALGVARLRLQDIEFSIDQLVEIAVRALSPGINDPFTAIACLDQLSTWLSDLAERTMPSGYHYDSNSRLRVISDVVTFNGIINAAFNQIRQHGRSDVAVTIRLLEVIAIIIARASSPEQRQSLLKQANMIKRGSEEAIFEENDRHDVINRYELIMRIVDDK